MKKNKDMLIKKVGISGILKNSDLTNRKECVEAYRGINAIHPIEWGSFESIINKGNALTKMSELILATKEPRKKRGDSIDDNYYFIRTGNKYKGRKKDKIWNTFNEAETILSGWSNAKWRKRLNISEDEFYRLIDDGIRYLIDPSESTKNKINASLSAIQKVTDKKTIKEFISQLFVLGNVFITFVTKLDEAEKQEDNSFLNKARQHFKIFEVSEPLIKGVKGKGRNINWKTQNKRLKIIKEYIHGNKKSNECFTKGLDYPELKDEYLIYLASRIYRLFYYIRLRRVKHKLERCEAIIQIRELMQKYYIRIEDIIPPQTTSNKPLMGLFDSLKSSLNY
jgi:hypothetical protein